MFRKIIGLYLFLLIVSGNDVKAQDTLSFWQPAPEYNKHRGKIVGMGLGATYVASMTGLYYLWYADYPLGEFHTFDDNGEWLQMDKVGHFGASYYLGKWGIDLMQWTGMKEKKTVWLGGTMGLAFLTTIEVFDGFSEGWGFSTGDMTANIAGSAMAISQELIWKEQRVTIKFSWNDTEYNEYNTGLLGDGFPQTLFKDYNGQTYWLSGNIKSFLRKDSKFPAWLNMAFGYGAEGMTGANDNSKTDVQGYTDIVRYRQFYLAPDIDLTKIKTKSKALKTVFGAFGFLKIPAPTMEYNNQNNFTFHWLYF